VRTLNEEENHLVATLGVYGIWLLKHGKNLPDDLYYEQIKQRYANLEDCDLDLYNNYAQLLMNEIDLYCEKTKWEPPIQNFDVAYQDLIETVMPFRNNDVLDVEMPEG
jgi:hypothetical protein